MDCQGLIKITEFSNKEHDESVRVDADVIPPKSQGGFVNVEPLVIPPVLDACCGAKLMWFDKKDSRTIYMDNRKGIFEQIRNDCGNKKIRVSPDILADFTEIPFPDNSFRLVVFDPPHVKNLNESSTIFKYYGTLFPGWQEMIQTGFSECFRVLIEGGILIFKWSETQIPLKKILSLISENPLFGQKVGRREKTHWITFMKSV